MFSQAIAAVQRNIAALGLYLAIVLGANVAGTAANQWVTPDPGINPFEESGLIVYDILLNFVLVAAGAGAQAVVFSRMGKEMDRPLCKIGGDGEALRRFFGLWFVLNAVPAALQEMQLWVSASFGNEAAFQLLVLLYFVANSIYIPIGASLMFTGRIRSGLFSEGLAPLVHQIPKTFLIVLFGGIMLVFCVLMMSELEPWARLLVTVIAAYFECVLFAASWAICMYDRENPVDTDLDF